MTVAAAVVADQEENLPQKQKTAAADSLTVVENEHQNDNSQPSQKSPKIAENEIEINIEPEILIDSNSFTLFKEESEKNLAPSVENQISPPKLKESESASDKSNGLTKKQEISGSKIKGDPTTILHVKKLVRPFNTSNLIKWLNMNLSNMDEDKFWMDSIKSRCIISFHNIDSSKSAAQFLSRQMWPITSDKLLEVEFIAESSVEETKNNSNSAKETKVSTKNGNALPSPVVKQAFDALENCFNKTNAEPHIFWMKYIPKKYEYGSDDRVSDKQKSSQKPLKPSSSQTSQKESRHSKGRTSDDVKSEEFYLKDYKYNKEIYEHSKRVHHHKDEEHKFRDRKMRSSPRKNRSNERKVERTTSPRRSERHSREDRVRHAKVSGSSRRHSDRERYNDEDKESPRKAHRQRSYSPRVRSPKKHRRDRSRSPEEKFKIQSLDLEPKRGVKSPENYPSSSHDSVGKKHPVENEEKSPEIVSAKWNAEDEQKRPTENPYKNFDDGREARLKNDNQDVDPKRDARMDSVQHDKDNFSRTTSGNRNTTARINSSPPPTHRNYGKSKPDKKNNPAHQSPQTSKNAPKPESKATTMSFADDDLNLLPDNSLTKAISKHSQSPQPHIEERSGSIAKKSPDRHSSHESFAKTHHRSMSPYVDKSPHHQTTPTKSVRKRSRSSLSRSPPPSEQHSPVRRRQDHHERRSRSPRCVRQRSLSPVRNRRSRRSPSPRGRRSRYSPPRSHGRRRVSPPKQHRISPPPKRGSNRSRR